MKWKKVRLATVFVLLIGIAGGLWWSLGSASYQSSSDILTSGFIEARNVAIALETGGRIAEIKADEGDRIPAGVPLVRLDDSLLNAQKQQAEATVRLAQASLEQATAARNQALVAQDGAKKIWEDALDAQKNPLELEGKIIAAQGELDMAKTRLEYIMQLTLPSWWDEQSARLSRDTAQKVLENLRLIRENPQQINAAVVQAHAAYQNTIAAVPVAEKALQVAAGNLEQAKASREIINVQLGKLTIGSPIVGVVAARYAEVGEIAHPGVPILTITELEEVTLTTYIPESKIGLVKLGQEAIVTVDSYPSERFSGKVVYISPQAVFTPRNVQLKEEREKTVFAVKIKLANPEQKLKPGMPADARILTK